MKFAFYFCTRKKAEDTLTYQSLNKIFKKALFKFKLFYDSNNEKGLSENYNQILKNYKNEFDYIIFLHDDLIVDDANICEKLIQAHKDYDIVGLAGGINPVVAKPALWHLMCGGFGSGNLRGAVAHPASLQHQNNQIFMTSFGPTPARVVILDGLFLSVNCKRIIETNWKFNENYKFHHYDIASSIDANNKKLKLGVTPIWVVHSSPGLLNPGDSSFLQSQEKFIQEYS